MKKSTIKLIAMLLCLAMIGSYLPMAAHAEEEATVYTLYPTPHSVEYGEGSFELADLTVLYDEGIDEYTKARLEETAALLDLSVTEAEDANVYVGIYGSGDAAESYILDNYDVDVSLFEKIDANFVAVNNGEIVVLGKDTDSAFYGLTTLYQIFGQLGGKTIRNLTINDYADVVSRGFIEGYYGNPWSVEDRANLMTWGGYYKLNSYFYAPKDDPKHNAKWRELYTEEEIETLIRPLAEAGNASKCRFVFALHPYMYNPITDYNYDESMAVMKAKFTQVIEAGVRQIAILADDAGNQGGSHYTRMLTDMTAWIKEMQAEYPDLKLLLPFVTQEYMYFGQSYYRNFPENIQIVMTGGQVWGFCSPSFTNTFYNNVGRGAYLWINWPCTDNSKNHLIMGGYADFLQPGVDPNKVEGIVLNPMQQSEPSKVAIFGNACYTWNMWETREEADAAWDHAFACVDHNSVVPNDASDALRELSKHMIDQTRFEDNPNVLEESVVLRHELSDFQSKLTAGTYTQEDIDSLVEEFTILQNASKIYREQGNERIVAQIEPWLGNWDDQTVSILSYLDALSAILNDAGDDVIWGSYAAGQSALESSKNHPLWYLDHYEYAESGYRFIVPFMKALDAYLAEFVKDIVDPSGALSGGGSGGSNPGGPVTGLTAFEENVPGYYSGSLNNVVDGDPNSALWYNDYGRVGQIIGVDLGKPVMIGTVTFTQNSGDHFSDYTLQYSMDGETYTDYKRYTDTVLTADLSADGIEARYIRFYNNASTSVWIKIHEIAVTEAAATTADTNNETAATWKTRVGNTTAELLTGGEATFAPGDYVGYDLRRIKDIATIEVAEQGELTLQISVNDVDWVTVEAGEIGELARYVRLINLTDSDVDANITAFTVTANVYSGPYLLESNIGVNSSWGVAEDSRDNGAAFDGNVGTTTEFGDFVTTGQYFIYDLGQNRDIYKLEIYCSDNAVNYIRDAEMQISNDLENWTTVLTIGDGVENTGEASVTCINSDAGYAQATSSYPNFVSIEGELDEAQTARYIRVIMTAPNNERAVLFNEIEINDGEYVSANNNLAFEVSHIEVQGYPPQNMVDGDLTTSWKPNTTEPGYMVYTFSDNLTANHINIVSKSASNAKVSVYVEKDGVRQWINKGLLNKSLVTLVCDYDLTLALKIEWDADSVPNITEIVRFTAEITGHDHAWSEWTVTKEATCTEAGVETCTCECGETQTREIPALGHEYVNGKCTRCGDTLTSKFEDVKAGVFYFDPVEWAVEKGITT
ncbi:MAG: beta-N-acetylglucosaminidase domain-containing protein, partial [Oscillospiraceae bacterium]|nr:beta-N-acetylglucosaminidase domain-containing protein [Oscillospiraceae bacterium]